MIRSFNEWDPLREVVVGSASHANWPSTDPVFAQESTKTLWHDTPVPSGAVPQWIIDETNQDLQELVDILVTAGVTVHRPRDKDFVRDQGMYNYCPRDRLLVAGEVLVDPAMMYPCRDQEIECLDFATAQAPVLHMPRGAGMVLDAANICRLNNVWLYLMSSSGNEAAMTWLQQQFPQIQIQACYGYAGVHIDSTIVPLREGLVVLNAHRVNEDLLPDALRDWDKIWVTDVVAQDFYQYPWASAWIALNMLSIDPQTVIMDADQTDLRHQIEQHGITVIPHRLRHSRTLGGGFHCVTLDLWRQNQ
jgi:glycine amidinotransferase/scyllo-inosamine-4-phosphate amidinotransferase 1